MGENDTVYSALILLGKTFLKTSRTIINVYEGTLTMEFDGEIIKFNIYDAMRYPSDEHTVLALDGIDPFVQRICDLAGDDNVKVTLENSLDNEKLKEIERELILNVDLEHTILELESLPKKNFASYVELPISHSKLLPSLVQAPQLELKSIPSHLKHVYLGEKETLPVIISSKLDMSEEERLL